MGGFYGIQKKFVLRKIFGNTSLFKKMKTKTVFCVKPFPF